jgi:hypothetical protein
MLPALPPPSSVLERVLAADAARKRAADERNALFVEVKYAANAPPDAPVAHEPLGAGSSLDLGASLLRRTSTQPAKRRRATPVSGPILIVPTDVLASGIPATIAREQLELFFAQVGPIARVQLLPRSTAPQADGTSETARVTYRTAGGASAAIRLLNGRCIRPGPDSLPVSIALVPDSTLEDGDRTPRPPGRPAEWVSGAMAPPPSAPAPPVAGTAELAQLMARTVVIRSVFTAADLAVPGGADAVRDDLWAECCKLGELEHIGLGLEAETSAFGCASVRFEQVLAAADCVDLMDGRAFCGRALEAAFWDGTAAHACALDVDRARQLRFGFGDAATRYAAEAAAAAAAALQVAADRQAAQLREFLAEVGSM